jgi:hypothetical protein
VNNERNLYLQKRLQNQIKEKLKSVRNQRNKKIKKSITKLKSARSN